MTANAKPGYWDFLEKTAEAVAKFPQSQKDELTAVSREFHQSGAQFLPDEFEPKPHVPISPAQEKAKKVALEQAKKDSKVAQR